MENENANESIDFKVEYTVQKLEDLGVKIERNNGRLVGTRNDAIYTLKAIPNVKNKYVLLSKGSDANYFKKEDLIKEI